MTKQGESDPLEALRRANPVDAGQMPSASLARIRARIQEDIVSATEIESASARKRLRAPRLVGIGIGATAIAVIALVTLLGGRDTAPGVVPGGSSDGGVAQCVEQYSPATLATRGWALDGTVTAISGDEVTFAVNRWFKGPGSDTVTMTAMGMTGSAITSAGGPSLHVGERYLAAGEDTFVWACGFTQPYDEAVAAEWAAAFGG